MSVRRKTTLAVLAARIGLVILALLFLFPFYWIVSGSFKSQVAVVQIPPEWYPSQPTMDNYVRLSHQPLLRWTFNSFYMSIATALLVCVTASLAGYALAKKRFIGSTLIFWLFIVAMSLPKQVIMIPLFNMLAEWKWMNTYKAVILPAVGWPFGVFLMKQFCQTIPSELIEAATIDGAGEVRTFAAVAFPIMKPGIGALAIFTFIGAWNDYFMQLILISSTQMKTLQLGIASMQQEFTTDYGVLMAGAAIAALPMIAVFISFQKYFAQGITMGAVKG